jgi:hypothetical protein
VHFHTVPKTKNPQNSQEEIKGVSQGFGCGCGSSGCGCAGEADSVGELNPFWKTFGKTTSPDCVKTEMSIVPSLFLFLSYFFFSFFISPLLYPLPCPCTHAACSFGWWLMAGAGLF